MTSNDNSDPLGGQDENSEYNLDLGASSKALETEPGHEDPSAAPLDDDPEMGLARALERLQQTEMVIRRHQDDVLRVQAEMQNLRRRTEQDVEKAHKFGQERLVAELLPVVDNLERALAAVTDLDKAGTRALYDGVDLTLKSFLESLRKFNVEAIDPLGEPFDPLRHQAILIVEKPDLEPNTVTAVMQKGYTLHGRVIRPAMVMVSK